MSCVTVLCCTNLVTGEYDFARSPKIIRSGACTVSARAHWNQTRRDFGPRRHSARATNTPRPPRPQDLGGRCWRIQAWEVLRWGVEGNQESVWFLPFRLGTEDLHWPELCTDRSQDCAGDDTAELLRWALSILCALSFQFHDCSASTWSSYHPTSIVIVLSHYIREKILVKVVVHSIKAESGIMWPQKNDILCRQNKKRKILVWSSVFECHMYFMSWEGSCPILENRIVLEVDVLSILIHSCVLWLVPLQDTHFMYNYFSKIYVWHVEKK